MGAHHEFLRVLVIAAQADGKVTAAERRDLDAAANLLALGPGIVEAYLYEESERSELNENPMRPDELERWLRARLDALGPAPRAEHPHLAADRWACTIAAR